ncbi:MAG: site-2 protease family protein [Candidatus Spyradocola sp.]|jgi:Zn-dependent protease
MWGLFQDPRSWLLQLVYMLPALVLGFTLHEFCHAVVAVRLGDPTPRLEGRVTLNPSAHIDWVGMLLFVLLGWGYAKPVRIQPGNLKGRKWGEALVALAGPLSNFFLAAVCFAVWRALPTGMWSGFFYSGATVNLTLCFLNLLPVPPLDGFAVVRALIPLRSYRAVAWLQRYGILILILLSLAGVLGRILGAAQGAALLLFSRIF